MVELGQWIHRETWQLPSRVIVLQRGAGRRPADYFAAAEAAGIPIEVRSLYDESGMVDPAVRSAEILISSAVPITAEDIPQLDRCRFILRPYVGYDDIDVDALTSRGILLANIPDAFSEEVAVHALALILAFNRFLFQVDRYVREGAYWARRGRADLPIHHPKALTLGIIGFGTIGQLLAERAKPLGFRMLAYDPFPAHEAAQRLGVTFSSLEEVLDQSDYLSLHVFLNTQTEHLMNEDRLRRMKRGAFLINTSRGKVVDERALVRVLESGHLGGAGLDVFEEEPIPPDHPLTRFPNVILTPHMASQSVEGVVRIRERANEILQQVALGDLPERKVVVNKSLFDAITARSAYREQVR